MSLPFEQFIAESAADAVAQIRAKLGADAVVVNVRSLPRRLWQGPRIEVLAHAPQGPAPGQPEPGEQRPEGRTLVDNESDNLRSHGDVRASGWRVGALLENSGFLPRYAECVVEELRATYGDVPPGSLAQELQLTRSVLCQMWTERRAGPARSGGAAGAAIHVFVGAPGVGKTTALCKWLTQAVLLDGRAARVWRLDGRTANTAELLSVHGEILSVPVERAWTGEPIAEELGFVDLPGARSAEEVAEQLAAWPTAMVHLVLNAAYESSLLLGQARAFGALPIHDLIVAHLDEEPRWSKLWNLVLGTGCSIQFLGAGQNIPGDFFGATPDRLLNHDFPLK